MLSTCHNDSLVTTCYDNCATTDLSQNCSDNLVTRLDILIKLVSSCQKAVLNLLAINVGQAVPTQHVESLLPVVRFLYDCVNESTYMI